ncbi:MAG: SDR family oxidoreductase [Thermoproteota archaeon]|nr:SDR family oxidoreductase [Thermoproteota archaeon]
METDQKLQILVTGGAGYIGSVLVKELLKDNHKVRCLDRFFFGKESLEDVASNPDLELIKDDTRWFDPKILKNADVVMDLAALSNDPAGELDPSKTLDINYLGRIRVARLSKEYGVRRYILASSCSLYGFQDGILAETSEIKPMTTYAKANSKAEQDVLPLADSKFTVTALRFATVYGYSGRMRFDLAINAMVLGLFKNPKIPVMREGTQWRPFIHVKDAAEAYKIVMMQPNEKVNGQVYNVGSDEQNFQILPLAELVGNSLDLDYQIEWYGSSDFRSYKVSFRKFKEAVNFRPNFTPREGAVEIFKALKSGTLVESSKTKTVEWYKHLISSYELTNEIALRNTIL